MVPFFFCYGNINKRVIYQKGKLCLQIINVKDTLASVFIELSFFKQKTSRIYVVTETFSWQQIRLYCASEGFILYYVNRANPSDLELKWHLNSTLHRVRKKQTCEKNVNDSPHSVFHTFREIPIQKRRSFMLNDASSPTHVYLFQHFFSTDWKSITSSAGSITSIFHRKSIIWEEKLLLYEKGRNYASLSTKKLPLPILNEFACDEPGTIGRHKLGYGHVIPLSKKKTPSTIPWLRENPTSV